MSLRTDAAPGAGSDGEPLTSLGLKEGGRGQLQNLETEKAGGRYLR